jgi:hypothetical protein
MSMAAGTRYLVCGFDADNETSRGASSARWLAGADSRQYRRRVNFRTTPPGSCPVMDVGV